MHGWDSSYCSISLLNLGEQLYFCLGVLQTFFSLKLEGREKPMQEEKIPFQEVLKGQAASGCYYLFLWLCSQCSGAVLRAVPGYE